MQGAGNGRQQVDAPLAPLGVSATQESDSGVPQSESEYKGLDELLGKAKRAAWATGMAPRNAADVNTQDMRSGAEYAPQSDGLGGAVLRRILFMGRRSPGSGRSSELSDGGIFCS